MNKNWSDKAWQHYLYWQSQDKKTLKKINELIRSIEREGVNKGTGKPEKLKYRDVWSRRIDECNRLIYDIDEGKELLNIYSCKGHYDD